MKNFDLSVAHALTVAKHYYKSKTYVIKRMLVKSKPDGSLYWYTFGNQVESPDRLYLENLAARSCKREKLPFISDLQHGQKLSQNDLVVMKSSGFIPQPELPFEGDKK